MSIVLNNEQELAKNELLEFILTPSELKQDSIIVLSGAAGTGKTMLLKSVIDNYKAIKELNKVINMPTTQIRWEFTAMTHKAARALSQVIKLSVNTLHYELRIRPLKHGYYFCGYDLYLEPSMDKKIIVVDEASYIDSKVLNYICELVSKEPKLQFILIGDPYQLPPVGMDHAPVFNAGFKTVHLEQSVRQSNAPHLAQTNTQVTLADLDEDLPSFRGSKAQKDEQIMMAIAWGYKNNIVIKKSFTDSILFLHADTIQETNLDNLIVSYTNSPDMTSDYYNDTVSIENLTQLVQMADFHWLSHHVEHGYRKEENAIAGFNLLVLDVDSSTKLTTTMMLLKKYTAIYYTTKRHQENGEDRYRIILPLNYTLKLDSKEYKELYNNVINSLPFEVDAQCGQRAKKWLTNPNAQVHTTEGELFDILPFIPKTSKNEEREKLLQDQSQMDNLERWVINNTGDGNRNNMLLRFAMILVDAGFSFDNIKDKVISLNNKMADKLDEIELYNTIFHSVAAKLTSIA